MLVDTPEQLAAIMHDESRSGGRVLVQEGLANDLTGAFNQLRRVLGMGVSERVEANLILGPTLAWALYWNREAFMKRCLVTKLLINGDDVSLSATTMVSDPIVPEGAHDIASLSPIKIGGPNINLPAFAVIN